MLLIVAINFVGCQIQATVPSTPAQVTTESPKQSEPKTACEQAQSRLEELCLADAAAHRYCCAVVMLTKKEQSFAQLCEEKQANGIFVNPECLASIVTCYDIDFCTRSK